jgi:hypothetical protein
MNHEDTATKHRLLNPELTAKHKYLKRGLSCEPTKWLSTYTDYLSLGGDVELRLEKFKLQHEFAELCSSSNSTTPALKPFLDLKDPRWENLGKAGMKEEDFEA